MKLIWFAFVWMLIWDCVVSEFQLQILHVADIHSRFVETDVYSAPCSEKLAKQKKCYGGFARLRKAVQEATDEASRNGVPSLFLNGGDNFQGTVYYTMYKWEIVADLVSKMGFDAVSLGNHEFYNGIDNLANYMKNVKTPLVCCNLNVTAENRLQLPNLTPSIVLQIHGVKVGIVGYLTTETAQKAVLQNVQILDEVPCVRAEAKRLKDSGVKIIIALGHSGLDVDKRIAEEVEEISVVIGAHWHVLMYHPKDHPPSTEPVISTYPTMVRQKSGKQVPVVHAYAYTKYLGKLTVRFDDNGDVIEATGNTQLLDASVEKDVKMNEHVAKWENRIKQEIRQVKGYSRVFLDRANFQTGQLESNLANLITDAFLDESVRYATANQLSTWTRASIAIYTNGGIQSVIDNKKNDGAITIEDLFNVLPNENEVIELSLYGKDIKRILEISVSSYNDQTENRYISGFLQFSGMRVVFDLSQPVGSRVHSAQVLCTYCDVPKYEPLQENNIYNVITVDYWVDSLKLYSPVKDAFITKTVLGSRDIDVVMKYIERNGILYPCLDNRVGVIGFKALALNSASFNVSLSKYLFWLMILFRVLY